MRLKKPWVSAILGILWLGISIYIFLTRVTIGSDGIAALCSIIAFHNILDGFTDI